MKFIRILAIFPAILLSGCQSFSQKSVTVIDGENILIISATGDTPHDILSEAKITTQPEDRVFVNGIPQKLDEPILSTDAISLQLRRAVAVTLNTQQGSQIIKTSAMTVGEVLTENGISINSNDKIYPPLTAPVTDSMTITFISAQALTITSGETTINIFSAAGTVGEALAEAGIPLLGLDVSFPAENEPLPANGQIQVTRVTEAVIAEIQSIPFSIEETESTYVAFGQQDILQNGVDGAVMVRTRVRYENGVEVKRTEEEKTVLKEPVKQIVAKGTKIVLSPVGGNAPYQYWYAAQMYATWYSPCNSGTGSCSYGTSSGARAGFGIVAVDYSIYPYLAGMKVYIPGYGLATIGDSGGGPIVETAFGVSRTQWIDLGYNDDAIGGLTGWVTVYFLEPAPAEIPYFFQ